MGIEQLVDSFVSEVNARPLGAMIAERDVTRLFIATDLAPSRTELAGHEGAVVINEFQFDRLVIAALKCPKKPDNLDQLIHLAESS